MYLDILPCFLPLAGGRADVRPTKRSIVQTASRLGIWWLLAWWVPRYQASPLSVCLVWCCRRRWTICRPVWALSWVMWWWLLSYCRYTTSWTSLQSMPIWDNGWDSVRTRRVRGFSCCQRCRELLSVSMWYVSFFSGLFLNRRVFLLHSQPCCWCFWYGSTQEKAASRRWCGRTRYRRYVCLRLSLLLYIRWRRIWTSRWVMLSVLSVIMSCHESLYLTTGYRNRISGNSFWVVSSSCLWWRVSTRIWCRRTWPARRYAEHRRICVPTVWPFCLPIFCSSR